MRAIGLSLALILGQALAAYAVDVTACGQVVPAKSISALVADLDCTGQPLGVSLGVGATLNLNGHTLSGGDAGGVRCFSGCIVNGPGTVRAAAAGISTFNGRLSVNNLTIDGCGYGLLNGSFLTRIDVTNVTITNSTGWGTYVGALKATNLTVSGSAETGIYAPQGLRGSGITANNNGAYGILAYSKIYGVRATNVVVSNNGEAGLYVGHARVDGLTAQGNGEAGVFATGKLILRDSVVTGNTLDGENVDLLTNRRPRLKNTQCDHSRNNKTGGTWHVCASD